jgi:hypothetical protein
MAAAGPGDLDSRDPPSMGTMYLTTEMPNANGETSAEFKITPAMIAAGARFLRETYEVSSEGAAAQMAESLFSEMVAAAPFFGRWRAARKRAEPTRSQAQSLSAASCQSRAIPFRAWIVSLDWLRRLREGRLRAHTPDAPARHQVASRRVLWSASEVLIRPLDEGGFELIVGLARVISLKTLQRLAECEDRVALIEWALDHASCSPSSLGVSS